jgi:signal transduction histidine kinase/CheY-like chemotaxis protein/HPt (histidine-containing phosphotransfer) domain-containing protein
LLPHVRTDPAGAETVRTDFEELVETFADDAYQYRKGAQAMVAREIRDSSAVIFAGLILAIGLTVLIKVAAGREEKERRERQEAEATNTELNRLSQNLAEALKKAELANDAKSRFLAGVTHELRTPLHGLLGYAELLSLEGDLNPTQAARLETMMAAGQHLLGMINSVLDMSQIEAERMDLQPAVLDLPELVRVCINVIRPKAHQRGLALGHTEFPDVCVNADPTRLRQVVLNLLGNAVKFTPSGHIEVRVRCQEGGEAVRVEVADSGPGVRDIHREKLFKTFERLNAAAVAGIEGSGLGLAISAKLVHMMGGRIGYDDNPSGGSIFWVELPVCDGRPEAEIAAPDEAAPAVVPKLRVLVADDEALNRSIAGSFLGRAGHEFVCVENGAQAVETALAGDFDLILMDVRMPVMNGMDATRKIRAAGGPRSQVRILAVTAQGFSEQLAMCQQAGMDGHVSKPFTMATLIGAVQAELKKPVAAPVQAAPDDDTRQIFEREIFMDTVEYMPAEEVMENLRMLIDRCQEMSRLMHGEAAAPEVLVEVAHKLAGASGMFGLLEASEAARALEHAAAKPGAVPAEIIVTLDAALAASITVLQEELESMMAV